MKLLKRKPKLTEEQQREQREEKRVMVEWIKKVWCPLHVLYPSARDQQAVNSGALYRQGHPGLSFLAASGGAVFNKKHGTPAERWRKMNPGEDFDAFMTLVAEDTSDYMDEHPEFREQLRRIGEGQ